MFHPSFPFTTGNNPITTIPLFRFPPKAFNLLMQLLGVLDIISLSLLTKRTRRLMKRSNLSMPNFEIVLDPVNNGSVEFSMRDVSNTRVILHVSGLTTPNFQWRNVIIHRGPEQKQWMFRALDMKNWLQDLLQIFHLPEIDRLAVGRGLDFMGVFFYPVPIYLLDEVKYKWICTINGPVLSALSKNSRSVSLLLPPYFEEEPVEIQRHLIENWEEFHVHRADDEFKIDDILMSNAKKLCLHQKVYHPKDYQKILKSWMRGVMPRLELLMIGGGMSGGLPYDSIFEGIQFERKVGRRNFYLRRPDGRNNIHRMDEGREITRRGDGRKAIAYYKDNAFFLAVAEEEVFRIHTY